MSKWSISYLFRPARALLALTAALVTLTSAPAFAITVTENISQNHSYPGGNGFNVTTQTVILPADFADASINISWVYANDAAVLQVNGTNIVGWGIFGPGNGNFAFSQSGPFVPFVYALGHGFSLLTVNQSYSAPFVVGPNIINVFHNDNGAGIGGNFFSVANGELQFNANLTYSTAAVPEPSTWALLLAGCILLGTTASRRARS
jgi:hypothetical protein